MDFSYGCLFREEFCIDSKRGCELTDTAVDAALWIRLISVLSCFKADGDTLWLDTPPRAGPRGPTPGGAFAIRGETTLGTCRARTSE